MGGWGRWVGGDRWVGVGGWRVGVGVTVHSTKNPLHEN